MINLGLRVILCLYLLLIRLFLLLMGNIVIRFLFKNIFKWDILLIKDGECVYEKFSVNCLFNLFNWFVKLIWVLLLILFNLNVFNFRFLKFIVSVFIGVCFG